MRQVKKKKIGLQMARANAAKSAAKRNRIDGHRKFMIQYNLNNLRKPLSINKLN